MIERATAAFETAIATFVAAVVSGLIWAVRRIFTNQKQIEMLGLEIERRDHLRTADSSRITELHKDVRELRNAVMRDE